jgi:hypothetical protein
MSSIFDPNKVKNLATKVAPILFPRASGVVRGVSSVASKLPQAEKLKYKTETKLNAIPGQAMQSIGRTAEKAQNFFNLGEEAKMYQQFKPTNLRERITKHVMPIYSARKTIGPTFNALGDTIETIGAGGMRAAADIYNTRGQRGLIPSLKKGISEEVQSGTGFTGGLQKLGVPKGLSYLGLVGSLATPGIGDVGKVGKAGKEVSGEGLEALMKEARKYKSAEEFVRKRLSLENGLDGISNQKVGITGSSPIKTVGEARAKMRNILSIELESVQKDKLFFDKYKNLSIEQLKKDIKSGYEMEGSLPRSVRVKEEILRQKSQLTDIYNQATKGVKQVTKIPAGAEGAIDIPVSKGIPGDRIKIPAKPGGDIYATEMNIGAGKFDATKELDKIIKSPAEKLSKQEVDTILTEQVLRESSKSKFKTDLDRIFAPLKNTPEEFQVAIGDWRKAVLTGRARANELVKEFVNIPEKRGLDFIRYAENPSKENAVRLGLDPKSAKKTATKLRKTYDSLREEGISKGLETGYLENYLNHVWKESMPEIQAKFNSAMGSAQFMKERVIPTYEEGLKLGLTPRYTHPSQLVAHYRSQLDKAVANKAFTDRLSKLGILLKPSEAPLDWRPIKAPLFPGNFKAPPEVARVLDNVFDYQSGGLMEAVARLSKAMQDIALSGGIPKTPINAFSLANTIKEVTAGRIKSPVSAFVRSLSDKATKNYFQKTAKYSKMMAEEGIPNYSAFDYNSFYKNLAESKTLKSVLGNAWYKGMNEPTFRRFLPQLQVNFFKDTYDSAIKSGMSVNEARRVAGDATKNFYGVVDTFTRSKFTEDTLSAIFMAPKFRETMVNFWGNTVRAFKPKNLTDAAYTANRKFVAGAAITFALYDALNYKLNERHMWDNKGGKELYLEIPRENGRSWFIPFLPSISTVPRRGFEAVGALLKGDTRTAAQRVTSLASMPINLGGQLLTNRTYYGAPIYGKEDNPLQRVGKLAGYSFEQVAPPIIGQPMAALQGRKTNLEAGLSMLELPVYPSKSTEPKKPTYAGGGTAKGGTLKEWLGGKALASDGSLNKDIYPKDTRDLAIVYKDALSTMKGYRANKVKATQGMTTKTLEEYQAEVDKAIKIKKEIEKLRPQQVLEIEMDTYGSKGSEKVEDRAKWANQKLTDISKSSPSEFNKILMQMYNSGVLTDSVVDEMESVYGKVLPYRKDVGIKVYSGKSRKKKASTKKFSTIYNQVQSAAKLPTRKTRSKSISLYDYLNR